MNFKEIYFEPINFIRSLYFKYIYKLSRYKDTIVVVQQNWIKRSLNKKFKFKNIVVNRPCNLDLDKKKSHRNIKNKEIIFFLSFFAKISKKF